MKNRPIINVRSRKTRKKREANERWEGRNSIMEKDPFLWSRWVIYYIEEHLIIFYFILFYPYCLP